MSLFQHDPTGFKYMKLREQLDVDSRANAERKKRACDDIMCNFEYNRRCSQDPEKCRYWLDREIEVQERRREGDR
jgi:hypothetical protein